MGRHARARRRDGHRTRSPARSSRTTARRSAQAHDALRYAAGNFYVNDKPTGAVVGQQPFGGARASGTNDKAGSMWNLIRWVSPRTVKETLVPPTDYRYPFLQPDGVEAARLSDCSRHHGFARLVRVLDAIRTATESFWDFLSDIALLPLARGDRLPPAEARVHEPRLAERPRGRLPGRARAAGGRSSRPTSRASASTRSSRPAPATSCGSSSRTARSRAARTRRSSRSTVVLTFVDMALALVRVRLRADAGRAAVARRALARCPRFDYSLGLRGRRHPARAR